MIILGIDPGTATTGYGIIKTINRKTKNQSNGLNCEHIKYGIIKTDPRFSSDQRLKKLYNELSKVIKKYQPKILVVENIYFFKNLKTAMPVSQAKGVILLAAAKNKIPTYEVTPLQVKEAVVGYGRAEKKQVQKMLKILFNLKEIPKPDDAADALAIALTYHFMFRQGALPH